MINRVLIRIKVLQILFAYQQNGSNDLKLAENELLLSLRRSYDLYYYFLLLIVEVTHLQERRLDMRRNRYRPAEEDLRPNTRLVDNRFARQIEANLALQAYVKEHGISWANETDFVKSVLDLILGSEIYAQYLGAKTDSYEVDRDFWRAVFRRLICGNESLEDALEDISIYWNDDIEIIETFVAAGAPEEIRYLQKPHIGTDVLRTVVKRLREKIIAMGGEVRFGTQVTDITMTAGRIATLTVNGAEQIPARAVFLGIGHSARDTYAMLHGAGVRMEAKAFAVGVRIEHPQDFVDRMQYGAAAGSPFLPTADYALTYRDEEGGRGVYSFCMCPGGLVVAAASEEGHLVTNGMSNYRRDAGTANSALLVQVTPADFGGAVLGGIAFQRELERRAFFAGGGDYRAPVQAVGDFLSGRTGTMDFAVAPTYMPGVRPAALGTILPDACSASLSRALRHWEQRVPGFGAADVPLTGVEARSSAPCRILRDAVTMQSISAAGLYPIGEGAGYAGGIMSAALDGMKAALAFLERIQ